MSVPTELRNIKQWVCWKSELRGTSKTKVPYTPDGKRASSTNPADWSSYEDAKFGAISEGFSGYGFVFTRDDPYVGIDLDHCIDESGALAPWAATILEDVGSYAEISPSGRGLKIFARSETKLAGTGRRVSHETGAIEIYDRGRYFTVTEDVYRGYSALADATEPIGGLLLTLFGAPREPEIEITDALVERCRASLAALPRSIQGSIGSNKLYLAGCQILRFGIEGDRGLELLRWYGQHCADPPWEDDRELLHKWKGAQIASMRAREFGTLAEAEFDPADRFCLDLIDAKAFLLGDYPQHWIIDNLLVEGESLIIGGPQKSLKTTLSLDLAVSLATGAPFLGHFPIARQKRVIVLSGESGRPTLQRNLKRILAAKGVDPDEGRLFLGFDLPQLSRADHLEELEREITRTRAEVAIIDPAYLCTLEAASAGDAANVFAMGSVLKGLTKIGTSTGCIMAVCHHAKRSARNDTPGLGDLSYAGWAEWARQWLMVRPKVPMRDGVHNLQLNVGGSAGQHGDYELEVNEGDNVLARVWQVKVSLAPGPGEPSKRKSDRADADDDRVVELIGKGFDTRAKIDRFDPEISYRRISSSIERLAKVGTIKKIGELNGGSIYSLAD